MLFRMELLVLLVIKLPLLVQVLKVESCNDPRRILRSLVCESQVVAFKQSEVREFSVFPYFHVHS